MRRRYMVTVLVAAALLVVGFGLAVYFAFVPSPEAPPSSHASAREQILVAPMPTFGKDEAMGGKPAALPADTITIPSPSREGETGVPTGFPRSAEGAVGQLAAIMQTVLQRMDVASTRAVYAAWSQNPPETVADWPLMRNVQSFLSAAKMTTLEPGATVTLTPAAAQIKGADGDWVVACVLMDMRASFRKSGRIAYGYCEPMQWQTDRWMIAAGPPAAQAPSVWPGTDLAREAGWLTWTDQP